MRCKVCEQEVGTRAHDCRGLDGPRPVEEGTAWAQLLLEGIATVAIAGGVLGLIASVATPTMGAQRSTTLRWQAREVEIEAARAGAADGDAAR